MTDLQRGMLWMQAASFIHVGIGQVAALVDLPFVREAATGYPYIPGSSLKGALRDNGRICFPPSAPSADETFQEQAHDHPEILQLFGEQENAGALLIGDGRLAFLPVRSLNDAYLLLTCPHILQRLARDRLFAGLDACKIDLTHLCKPEAEKICTLRGEEHLFIEEHRFAKKENSALEKLLGELFAGHPQFEEIKKRAVVMNDATFNHFAQRGLHVRTRNKLNPQTKTVQSGQLWSEESLPPETLLYAVISPRNPSCQGALGIFEDLLGRLNHFIQVGGNETVGEGWFCVQFEKAHPPTAHASAVTEGPK